MADLEASGPPSSDPSVSRWKEVAGAKWLVEERRAVDHLLSVIARLEAKKREGIFGGGGSSSSDDKKEKEMQAAIEHRYHYSQTDDDDTLNPNQSLTANSALANLRRIIRSDDVLHRFLHKYVIARSGRFESAAERVLNLCEVLEKYPHLTAQYDSDVMKCLTLGAINPFPFRQASSSSELDGSVLLFVKLSRLDWDKVTIEQMEKTFFWIWLSIIMMPNHCVQIGGVAIQMDGSDVESKHIKMAFHLFIIRMWSQCLPVRMRRLVMYKAPFFVRNIVFPVFSLAIPEKMRSRVKFTDNVEDIVKELGKDNLALEFGGPWDPHSVPSESDLAFIAQWTTARKFDLPSSAKVDDEE